MVQGLLQPQPMQQTQTPLQPAQMGVNYSVDIDELREEIRRLPPFIETGTAAEKKRYGWIRWEATVIGRQLGESRDSQLQQAYGSRLKKLAELLKKAGETNEPRGPLAEAADVAQPLSDDFQKERKFKAIAVLPESTAMQFVKKMPTNLQIHPGLLQQARFQSQSVQKTSTQMSQMGVNYSVDIDDVREQITKLPLSLPWSEKRTEQDRARYERMRWGAVAIGYGIKELEDPELQEACADRLKKIKDLLQEASTCNDPKNPLTAAADSLQSLEDAMAEKLRTSQATTVLTNSAAVQVMKTLPTLVPAQPKLLRSRIESIRIN